MARGAQLIATNLGNTKVIEGRLNLDEALIGVRSLTPQAPSLFTWIASELTDERNDPKARAAQTMGGSQQANTDRNYRNFP